jgi:hypothetical protein
MMRVREVALVVDRLRSSAWEIVADRAMYRVSERVRDVVGARATRAVSRVGWTGSVVSRERLESQT